MQSTIQIKSDKKITFNLHSKTLYTTLTR